MIALSQTLAGAKVRHAFLMQSGENIGALKLQQGESTYHCRLRLQHLGVTPQRKMGCVEPMDFQVELPVPTVQRQTRLLRGESACRLDRGQILRQHDTSFQFRRRGSAAGEIHDATSPPEPFPVGLGSRLRLRHRGQGFASHFLAKAAGEVERGRVGIGSQNILVRPRARVRKLVPVSNKRWYRDSSASRQIRRHRPLGFSATVRCRPGWLQSEGSSRWVGYGKRSRTPRRPWRQSSDRILDAIESRSGCATVTTWTGTPSMSNRQWIVPVHKSTPDSNGTVVM